MPRLIGIAAVRKLFLVGLALGAVVLLAGCSGKTTGATNITTTSATLNSIGRCDSGQTCKWYWEYWRADYPRVFGSQKTPVQGPVQGATPDVPLSTTITGLSPSTTYRWVFCGSPDNGGHYFCVGPNGTLGSTTADPPPDYETFTTTAKLYIALGDSATQIGSSSGQRYPERFFGFLQQAGAADRLHNIGESGQTSGGLNGGQLDGAKQHIDEADTDTAVITIDIGGNDILETSACSPTSASFDLVACKPTLETFATNFAYTLNSLNSSLGNDPGVEQVIAMAYYNPWSGRSGQDTAAANAELVLLGSDRTLDCKRRGTKLGLNDRIACIAADHGARLADAYPPFVGHGAIGDYFADTIHPNDTGHQVIADTFAAAFTAAGP